MWSWKEREFVHKTAKYAWLPCQKCMSHSDICTLRRVLHSFKETLSKVVWGNSFVLLKLGQDTIQRKRRIPMNLLEKATWKSIKRQYVKGTKPDQRVKHHCKKQLHSKAALIYWISHGSQPSYKVMPLDINSCPRGTACGSSADVLAVERGSSEEAQHAASLITFPIYLVF